MLTIRPTGNLTGVTISGDYWDIDELLVAINEVCGDEKRYYDFLGSRHRILKVCLLLRNAIRGEHNVEFVSNGVHKEVRHNKKVLAPEKNVYFSVEVLWPEILFMVIALNDFIKLHQEMVDDSYWNIDISTIRHFQAVVCETFKEIVPEEHFEIFIHLLHTKQPAFFRYATQFVDVLNLEYIALSKQEREEQLSVFALRYLMEEDTYIILYEQLMTAAKATKLPLHDLEISVNYPDIIIW